MAVGCGSVGFPEAPAPKTSFAVDVSDLALFSDDLHPTQVDSETMMKRILLPIFIRTAPGVVHIFSTPPAKHVNFGLLNVFLQEIRLSNRLESPGLLVG